MNRFGKLGPRPKGRCSGCGEIHALRMSERPGDPPWVVGGHSGDRGGAWGHYCSGNGKPPLPEIPEPEWHDFEVAGVQVRIKTERGARGELVCCGLHIEGGPVDSQTLATIKLARLLATAALKGAPSTPFDASGLGRPDGGDEFYRRFAAAYRHLAVETHAPLVAVAVANSVPVDSARRWAKEARRRGILGPASSTRACP